MWIKMSIINRLSTGYEHTYEQLGIKKSPLGAMLQKRQKKRHTKKASLE